MIEAVGDMTYLKVDNFVVKCRAYPTKSQAEKIDKILHGLRVAYNTTAYEMTKGNEKITKPDKKDLSIKWPDFGKCMKKEWLDWLRENREAVSIVPSTSLASSCYGIFGKDMKKAWESKKLPCGKWEPRYYSNRYPRRSFTVQTITSGFDISETSKASRINVTGLGRVKIRGWRDDLLYGDDCPVCTFNEFYAGKKKTFGVTVSKDNCGDYYLTVMLQTVWKPVKQSMERIPIGIDVGIKDIAITSDGEKYENKHFKKEAKTKRRRLQRKVSRRYGWANIEFRNEHKKDDTVVPSEGYKTAKLKLARLERKVARRRENYNHNLTSEITKKASLVAIESLNVKGMMKNHHLADALSDAAMSDVLQKLKYKATWNGVSVSKIGQWVPSSQLCSVCGYRNKGVKNLSVREWICPNCGSHHDRDVNAAKNILMIAQMNNAEAVANRTD